jgi:hypothetical protein
VVIIGSGKDFLVESPSNGTGHEFYPKCDKNPALNAEIVCYMLDKILASYTPRTLPKLFRKCGLQCFLDLLNKILKNLLEKDSHRTFLWLRYV